MTQEEPKNSQNISLIGKKMGMTQEFDDKGNMTPCTVLMIEPNQIVQVKTVEKDGYQAIQLSAGKVKVKRPETLEKRVTKPIRGHYSKAKVEPHRHLHENRVKSTEGFEVGAGIGVEIFEAFEKVDATAVSKGKGYQGVMKRHGFAGGPASHGSGFHRHAGSTGMRSTPGRNFPGGKKAGQMGNKQVTTQSLKIVEINKEENVLIVKGAVPGPVGGWVRVSPAVKMYATA